MTKNLMGKERNLDDPYAIFEGWGPFGETTVHLLKVYQKPSNELSNPYAKWSVAVLSDMTDGEYHYGDEYPNNVCGNLTLTYKSAEFSKQYANHMDALKAKAGFETSTTGPERSED
jgi:hypothetical protein